ncbi:MAG: hypothetical protein INR62_03165 [Rhodospirillales bacterium]|nr:hypothetical protein [Acetobacter sp.]
MRAPLKTRRPSPAEALAIAAHAAPEQPPTQIIPPGTPDGPTTLNLRVRRSTVASLEAVARERGMTMKQVVAHALRTAGVAVAEADMEDRTPRRR